MINARIPTDTNFNFYQAKKTYEKYQSLIGDTRDFQTLTLTTFFYSFFDDKKYLGSIYYYYENDKLFVNGYANRHHHLLNLECIKETLTYFNCDIYARALHRTSALCLLKCGFTRIKDNLFIYERKK